MPVLEFQSFRNGPRMTMSCFTEFHKEERYMSGPLASFKLSQNYYSTLHMDIYILYWKSRLLPTHTHIPVPAYFWGPWHCTNMWGHWNSCAYTCRFRRSDSLFHTLLKKSVFGWKNIFGDRTQNATHSSPRRKDCVRCVRCVRCRSPHYIASESVK